MIILGIETSGLGGGVAVITDDRVIAERDLARGLMHGRNLVPILDEAFGDAGVRPDQIDLIAVNRGPGSHTGLRIGVVAAKTLAWSLGKPLAGIDAVDALIAQAPIDARAVVPAIDARLGRIYGGVRVGDAWILPPARRDAATLLAAAPEGAVVIGTGASALGDAFDAHPGLVLAPKADRDVRAATVARLAAARPALGEDQNRLDAIYFG